MDRGGFWNATKQALPTIGAALPRKIVYSWAERAWTLPTVVSLCGLHGAIAVAAEFDDMPELKTFFNVSGEWADAYSATKWLSNLRDNMMLPQNFTQNEFMLLQDPGLLEQGFNVDLAVAKVMTMLVLLLVLLLVLKLRLSYQRASGRCGWTASAPKARNKNHARTTHTAARTLRSSHQSPKAWAAASATASSWRCWATTAPKAATKCPDRAPKRTAR